MVAAAGLKGRLLPLAAVGLTLAAPTVARPEQALDRVSIAATRHQERLAALLAMPFAGELTGARGAPRFAWVENVAGVRNIRVADRGERGRLLTRFEGDDGTEVYDLSFSPDADRIAFVRGGDPEFPDAPVPNSGQAPFARKQQVFVQRIGGGEPALAGEGHMPVFSPDGRTLAFVAGGELWLRSGEEAARRVVKVAGTMADLGWSPDGSRLVFTDNRRDHGFVAVFTLAGDRLDYLDPGFGQVADPIFSPDGREVAFVRQIAVPAGMADAEGPSLWSIAAITLANGAARTVWSPPPGTGSRFAGTRERNLYWTTDGQLVFPSERSGWLHAYAVPAAGGAARDLTPGTFEVESFVLDPTGRTIVYSANVDHTDRRHLWRRSLSGGSPQRLTDGDGIESRPVYAGNVLGAIVADARHPSRPARIAAGGSLDVMGAEEESFAAARDFVVPQPVTFRAADGVVVHAQLFLARGAAQGVRRPAVIFAHGGPRRQMLLGFHQYRYYSNSYIMNQHLAARGYHVLSVNYRGGTGYGRAFREAPGTGRDGASEYRDIEAAAGWMAGCSSVDPHRIGMWGGSWGGYLTALALARDSGRFAAGVDLHGVHTLLRDPPASLSPAAQQQARERMWQASPLASIDRWRSPVLLIAGDDDRNVDFSQSVLLARELAARGVPHDSLVFANERHDFLRHVSWLRAYVASAVFLDRHLAGSR